MFETGGRLLARPPHLRLQQKAAFHSMYVADAPRSAAFFTPIQYTASLAFLSESLAAWPISSGVIARFNGSLLFASSQEAELKQVFTGRKQQQLRVDFYSCCNIWRSSA